MRVTVNGKPRDVEDNVTVARLLEQLNMRPEIVHVQVNGDIVPREQLAKAVLSDGDTVDIVMSMGGGSVPLRAAGALLARARVLRDRALSYWALPGRASPGRALTDRAWPGGKAR